MQLKITHLKNKLAAFIVLSFATVIALSNAAGPIAAGHGGRTGASFDTSSCGSCHTGGTALATVSIQLLSGTTPVTEYIAGASYTLKLRVTSAGISTLGYYYGVQTVCIQSSTNNDINDWGTIPGVAHSATWNSRTYIEQSATLHSTATPFLSIPWTAPASGTGDVIFYAGGCIVNNNTLPTGDVGATSSLTVTEASGCVPATLSATPSDVTCNGYGDGSINLTATGGTGAIGYSWTGPGGYSATTENISGLSGGVYTVVVTSVGGCTATTTATVNEPAALNAVITSNSPVCPGGTLTFTTTVTGGTGGSGSYAYTWDGPNSFTSGIPEPSVTGFSYLDSGVYTFSVLDILSCSFTTTIDVALAPAPVFSLGADTTICSVSGSLIIGTTISGDTYLWSTTATSSTITVTDTGYYSETITNTYGCSTSDTVHIGFRTCDTTTSVMPLAISDITALYPNPASDLVSIHNEGNNNLQHISVYNAYGFKLYERHFDTGTTTHEIDLSRFAAGVYSVQIESAGSTVTKKLVITR